LLLALLAHVPACLAGGGLFGIDHELSYDNSGIWKRGYQEALEYGLIGGEVVGALWEGGETRFGRTLWQSVDASAASGVVAFATVMRAFPAGR
jgi:undecaprenyl-diphosphatase